MIFFRRETNPPPACAGTNVKQSTTVLHLLYNNADESFDIRNDLFIACMVQCHEQNLVTNCLKKSIINFQIMRIQEDCYHNVPISMEVRTTVDLQMEHKPYSCAFAGAGSNSPFAQHLERSCLLC